MMLWSIVAPVSASAGHCAGTEAVKEALAGADHHTAGHSHAYAESSSGHHHGDHHKAPHHHAGHHDDAAPAAETHSGDQSHTTLSKANSYSYCCTDARSVVLRSTLDATTLTRPVITWTASIIIALHPAFVSARVDQARPLASAFKIGASPPWSAIASQHTYQRTCLLLI
jgi:hypothetical protein